MSLNIKKLIPIGLVAAIALTVVVANFSNNPTPVSAQAMAKKSLETVSQLPAESQESLHNEAGFDMRNMLSEAQNAPDLKTLSYEEWAEQNMAIVSETDETLNDLKFLRYTSSSGHVVTLGIGQDDIPEFVSINDTENNQNPEAEGKNSTTIRIMTDEN